MTGARVILGRPHLRDDVARPHGDDLGQDLRTGLEVQRVGEARCDAGTAFDGDLEAEEGLPEAAVALQEMLLAHDGLLIASPEYNSGISSSLKTYIDWTSRPRGELKAGACYHGKTVTLMAASPGALGGIRGLPQARSILGAMGALVLPDDFALGRAHEAFDDEGAAKDEYVRRKLENLGKTLTEFLIRLNG